MIAASGRQRWLMCWSVSFLFHGALLIFCMVGLIHPPHFHVQAGITSTEMHLILEPNPVPAAAPAIAPPPPPRIAVLPAQPIPAQELAKPQPPRPPAPRKVAPVRESSSASRGAVQAQPDELYNQPPEYPEESRAAREQGSVILRVEVTGAGEPVAVNILKSSGYFRLDQAARRAVQHWKFHPAMTAGIPVSSEADVPVHFKLQ
jgi:protein TonB